MCGVNVLVKDDCSPLSSVRGRQVGRLLAGEDNVPPGRHLIVHGEVTGTSGFQGHLCLLADLHSPPTDGNMS